MSYSANQYNHATPLSSVAGLVAEQSLVQDKKYFTLFDNVLDGSYSLIDGDVGLWGATVANENGVLPERFMVTVTEQLTINAFRLTGSQHGYPKAFTVRLYNGSTILYTITETNNTKVEYTHYLPRTIVVTKYEVIVTEMSAPGVPARLYNLYNLGYVKRADSFTVTSSGRSDTSVLTEIHKTDTLHMYGVAGTSDVTNTVAGIEVAPVHVTHSYDLSVLPFGTDTITIHSSELSEQLNILEVPKDILKVKQPVISHIVKTLGVATDTLVLNTNSTASSILNNIDAINDVCPIDIRAIVRTDLMNVHSVMKQPTRRIYGKVYITYTDPMLTTDIRLLDSGSAYNSNAEQVLDSGEAVNNLFFTLYDNDLSGAYVLSDENSPVGWVSEQLSNELGEFTDPAPYIRISFHERPINSLRIVFDDSHASIAKDFTVEYVQANGNVIKRSVVDNTSAIVEFNDSVANVVSVVVTITKVTKAFYPVSIIEIPTLSTYLYVGYKDRSDLISIDLLEELTYDDTIEALGGVSANEVSVALDNSDGTFYFNNADSPVASSLRRNRRIEPWLGVEITPGEIEWYALGTFWSYRWDVPVEGLVAKVVGFDTIGLLDHTYFSNHHVQVNKSIGDLVDYVLTDAKKQFSFLTWKIDPALYDVVIPYAWFEVASHTAALRKISMCYPMHIYCDRSGAICAAPQKLHVDFYYDTWSDSTNVLSKEYSSLYTALPNIISVEVKNPEVLYGTTLAEDNLVFDVTRVNSRTLNFNEPYLSDINVEVTCDPTVSFTYEAYSWGIVLNFTGTGSVTYIKCIGTSLGITRTSMIVGRNEQSIINNGAVKRNVSSDFIQRIELANELVDRIMSLSENDKFDVDVQYRGDISLTINDPILLFDGIAPDNRYNIRRHELFWNGSLRGSAHLNT